MNIQNYDIRIVSRTGGEGEEALSSALTRHLLQWWRGYGPGKPGYSDFDIADHLSIADNVFLVKVLDENSFNIRLCGEAVAEVIGFNTMGQIIHVDGPEETSVEREFVRLARYYRSIVRNADCSMCFGRLTNRYDLEKRFESVDCPLFNKRGKVAYIIGVLVPLNECVPTEQVSLSKHIL